MTRKRFCYLFGALETCRRGGRTCGNVFAKALRGELGMDEAGPGAGYL